MKTSDIRLIRVAFFLAYAVWIPNLNQQVLAQDKPPAEVFNYDESAVPPYVLPELLVAADGSRITNVTEWETKRRGEIFRLFETQMYGKIPTGLPKPTFELIESSEGALEGRAIRKQIRMSLGNRPTDPRVTILLYAPVNKTNSPVFLGLNFMGNQSIHSDPAILITESWVRESREKGEVENNRATEASRGKQQSRWQADLIIQRGYALATAYYGDIDPDFDDGFQNGVHPLGARDGESRPGPDGWGSLAAWGWGVSKIVDYLETEPLVNSKQVAVIGHSRLGKAAIWGAAVDERIAMVISNESGCGGAALNKRWYGETVNRINTSFPHWFCGNFKQYNNKEADMPFDQHQLLALIAPRPLYVASAVEDRWADPRGEFLATYLAQPVYALYGKEGLGVNSDTQPEIEKPLKTGFLGYHNRQGKHDVTEYDWQQYLDFADRHFIRAEKSKP